MMELLTALFLFLKTGEKFATQEIAGPTVAVFTDHLGKEVDAKFEPRVLNDPARAVELCSKQKVAVGIVTPGFFLTYQKALGMEPLLEVTRANVPTEHYVLVTDAKGSDRPEDWAGKAIATTLGAESRYVMGVILQNKFGDEVRLQRTDDVEGAVFDIGEHAAKAPAGVLLEEAAWKLYADDPELGPQLKPVYRSPALPGPLVVAFAANTNGLDIARLKTALQKLGESEEGRRILQSIQIESFHEIDEPRLTAARNQFHGP